VHFSVVIATKDRSGYLDRTLASLTQQSGAPMFEVIVVDNGSSDETPTVIERYRQSNLSIAHVFDARPNRGRARNLGVARATGDYIAFCDDDVWLPEGWLAAHAAAQAQDDFVVNGPILNVPGYDRRPKPSVANYSGAFLCTCNASLAKVRFERAGGFDESFELYGWEDTELGLRLRAAGARRRFAWDAYLWHIKRPSENTLAVQLGKAVEKARMARRFVNKHPSARARLATGAHGLNRMRARYLLPDWLLALYGGVATSDRAPSWIAGAAAGQLVDALYTRELVRGLDADDAG
jgi:glycosyltransferase involved in cell wall biosynthesis